MSHVYLLKTKLKYFKECNFRVDLVGYAEVQLIVGGETSGR